MQKYGRKLFLMARAEHFYYFVGLQFFSCQRSIFFIVIADSVTYYYCDFYYLFDYLLPILPTKP